MRHARTDYDRIQDPAGLIPANEPVFLIRGQDPVGADAVRAWADLAEAAGTEPRVIDAVRAWAVAMDTYRHLRTHGPADVPAGALFTENA